MFKKTFDQQMHKAQKKMLPFAKNIGKNYYKDLDCSEQSVSWLDEVLAGVSKELVDSGLDEEAEIVADPGTNGIAESLGCYIVEVIESNDMQGEWINIDPESGEPRIGYVLGDGNVIFPIEWVVKKLINPQGYSIYDAYKSIVGH